MPADAPLLCSPPQEELFMEGNLGIFEREKDLHSTSEVDIKRTAGSFLRSLLRFLSWCLNETDATVRGRGTVQVLEWESICQCDFQ